MSTHPDENDQTLPATPADAIRRLGDPSAVFKPGMENLIAGIILALLMILAGLPRKKCGNKDFAARRQF